MLTLRRARLACDAPGPASDDPWAPVISCFCVLWGGLGLKLWARQEAWLALRWAHLAGRCLDGHYACVRSVMLAFNTSSS